MLYHGAIPPAPEWVLDAFLTLGCRQALEPCLCLCKVGNTIAVTIQEEVPEKVGKTGIKLTLGSFPQISFRYSLGTGQLTEEETEAQESQSEIF